MRDRRGTVTIFFAIWGLAVFGLAAIGVDGGYWYLLRRQAQNAADAAAMAGVVSLAFNGTAAVSRIVDAGEALATDNGFGTGATVAINGFTSASGITSAVNPGPTSGPYAGNPNAVEAIIHRPAPALLTRLIDGIAGIAPPTVGVRAVALLASGAGKVCVLSETGTIEFTGASVSSGPGCVFASNYTGSPAIYTHDNGTAVTAYTLFASGRIDTSMGSVTLAQPPSQYQLPSADPYAAANSYVFSTSPAQSFTTAPQPGYYSGISISGNKTYNFASGVYVIGSGGFTVHGTANLNCSACTFVVTNGGTIDFNGTGTFNLTALSNDSAYPALDGVLFYTKPQTGPCNGSCKTPTVTINGTPAQTYDGSMYFPGITATISGNSSITNQPLSTCFSIVAGSLVLGGSSATNIETSGCTSLGGPPDNVRVIQMVE